jgi:anti-sigma regulatory factor (Ser/Thr protein kinase)/CheY-like chemotaxis protein
MEFATDRTLVPRLAKRLDLPEDQPPRIVIVAQPEVQFSKAVEFHFADAGWEVLLAGDLASAEPALAGGATALVIADLTVPDADTVLRRVKTEPKTNLVPVIALHPRETDLQQPGRLRVVADLDMVEPFQVRALLASAEEELSKFARKPETGHRRLEFVFPSDRESIEDAAELATRVFTATGLSESERTSFATAFREAAANAVQHGNQGDHAKTVHVVCNVTEDRITISIQDQGPGFDYRFYLDQAEGDAAEAARRRHDQGGQGGLGIVMIVRCTDSVVFNDAGNMITLTKYLLFGGSDEAPS